MWNLPVESQTSARPSLKSWIEAIEKFDNPEAYEEKSRHARNDMAWYSLDGQLDQLETMLFSAIDKTE